MLTDHKTIDSVTELYAEIKSYIHLQKEYLTLDLVEKLTLLLSAIILWVLLMCLGMVALFHLSFAVIHLISPFVGGQTMAYTLMTVLFVILMAVVYYTRKRLIIDPVTRFIGKVLLRDNEKGGRP